MLIRIILVVVIIMVVVVILIVAVILLVYGINEFNELTNIGQISAWN